MPAGMWARHDSIGQPTARNSVPSYRRCAATDRPYCPAPTTTFSTLSMRHPLPPALQRFSHLLGGRDAAAGSRRPGADRPAAPRPHRRVAARRVEHDGRDPAGCETADDTEPVEVTAKDDDGECGEGH